MFILQTNFLARLVHFGTQNGHIHIVQTVAMQFSITFPSQVMNEKFSTENLLLMRFISFLPGQKFLFFLSFSLSFILLCLCLWSVFVCVCVCVRSMNITIGLEICAAWKNVGSRKSQCTGILVFCNSSFHGKQGTQLIFKLANYQMTLYFHFSTSLPMNVALTSLIAFRLYIRYWLLRPVLPEAQLCVRVRVREN